MSSTAEAEVAPPHILIFPFPAAGHMNPLLDLAHILSLRGLSITILVTPKNVPLLQPLLSCSPSISTLVLPFPSSSSLPQGVENLRSLPTHLFSSMIYALGALHGPLLNWARSASPPPDAIISDFFLGWTHATAAELGIPRLVFCPSPAAVVSIVDSLWKEMPKCSTSEEETLAFLSLPGSPTYAWYQLSSLYRAFKEGDERWEHIRAGFLGNIASWGCVFNSLSDIEREHLQHMREKLGEKRVWAVGPLIQERGEPKDWVLGWLDGRPEGSVLYVCFGSQITLKAAQAAAVAAALEKSGAAFLWVVGGAEPPPIPPEFEERTADRGRVVRGWAPQRDILSHPAVGSFLTHCGWNSILEGIVGGVVFLTWPMAADQFINARLIGKLAIGLKACERIEAVPDPDELAQVMARSVNETIPERGRVMELSRKAGEAVMDGGDSHRQIGELVDELRRLKTTTTRTSHE